MIQRVPITEHGLQKLIDQLERLKTTDRPAIIKAISEARAHGDLAENAEYHAAREQQSFIETKILELEDKLNRAEVINISEMSGKSIRFGASVQIIDENSSKKKKFQIVGAYEADPKIGLLSVNSPLARALINKNEGDIIEVDTPKGNKEYKIVKVTYTK